MSKYVVTLGASTGPGSVCQCCVPTATINKQPIATVGALATFPLAVDVLIEGAPGILLNGLPIAFSTAKTALGGCLSPNTSVKIDVASDDAEVAANEKKKFSDGGDEKSELQTYVGFSEAPRIENREEEEEEPEENPEIKIYSDYARNQLKEIASTDDQAFFVARMMTIFGEDVSVAAYEKLYKKARDGSVDNPEIVVCRNPIYGLSAAYNSKNNRIYISEHEVFRAVEDNHVRHRLMLALVEEYGHHIDYLLRYELENNANKDAKGDEGARFAYQGLYHISYKDYINTPSTVFAQVEMDGNRVDLAWEYTELHKALRQYTERRQYGTDDHVGKHYEGFKVEDLSRDGGLGHENIQREAVQYANNKYFLANASILFRGNWLRDYSQLIAPALLHQLGKMNLDALWGEQEAGAVEEEENKRYGEVFRAKKAIPLLQDLIRLLIIRKFGQGEKRVIIRRQSEWKDFFRWREVVDDPYTGLIPGFERQLGVSVPHDHCDNPFGMPFYEDLKELHKDFERPVTAEECSLNKEYGMKNYLRTNDPLKASYGTKVVFDHLLEKLKKVDRTQEGMVELGGALHILQDFYAHSNYTEICLVKRWFDRVKTWTSADHKKNYEQMALLQSGGRGMVFVSDVAECLLRKEGYQAFEYQQKYIRWYPKPKNLLGEQHAVNKKAFFAPITTGTYGTEDLLASLLEMLDDKLFAFTPAPTKKEKKNEKITRAGELTMNNLLVLLGLEYFDASSAERNGTERWVAYYNKYLDMRDWLLDVYQKERELDLLLFKVPFSFEGVWKKVEYAVDKVLFVDELLEPIIDEIERQIDETVQLVKYFFFHQLVKGIMGAIMEYQLVLKENMENSIKELSASVEGRSGLPNYSKTYKQSLWGSYPSDDNPSHTMLAKDSAAHPLNGLAGKLAVEATKKMLSAVTKKWASGSERYLKEELEKLIAHPLLEDTFGSYVDEWASENFYNLLKASCTANFFEILGIGIYTADKARRFVEKKLQKGGENMFLGINRLLSEDACELTQSWRDQMGKNSKELKKLFSDLVRLYKNSGYLETDAEIFVELHDIYVRKGYIGPLTLYYRTNFVDRYKHIEVGREKLKAAWIQELQLRLDYMQKSGHHKLQLPGWLEIYNKYFGRIWLNDCQESGVRVKITEERGLLGE